MDITDGKLKKRMRIHPSDITMNIGKGVPVPECPIETLVKTGSALKGQSDKEKYEKAKNLMNNIDNIRATFTKTFTSKNVTKKQIAVTTYLIDKLAVRAGNEKDHEECVASQRNDRAIDKCQKEKWKTVNGEDLLRAMSTLDFENYLEPLKAVPCEVVVLSVSSLSM
ncbi:Histone-fold protein [Raphanus sativus]|nr:Histone-fold protein [Raphanus sativus]